MTKTGRKYEFQLFNTHILIQLDITMLQSPELHHHQADGVIPRAGPHAGCRPGQVLAGAGRHLE
jgi:hypothetical protein